VGDALDLNDEVFRKELLETLDIVRLIGVDVVEVELLDDRQVFSRLVSPVFLVPSVCDLRSLRMCTTKGAIVQVLASVRRDVSPRMSLR
jgi:hypothetical protein